MNINKKFNPTEHENKAAIDALKAEVAGNPYASYHSARVGQAHEAYRVRAYRCLDGMDVSIAEFIYFDGLENSRHDAREMAESLARQINSQKS